MTRNGKIARLPAALREEINRRLDDGQKSKVVLAWLNALAEVKAVLDAEFGGRPLTTQNLSEWKTGGYAAWVEGRQLQDSLNAFMEQAVSLEAIANGQLTERISTMLTATIADQMRRLMMMPDGIEKARIWKELRISILALKQSDLCARKLEILGAKHAKGRDASPRRPQTTQATRTAQEKKELVYEMLGMTDLYDGALHPELIRAPEDRPKQNVVANPTKSE